MLLFGSKLHEFGILSLRDGGRVADVISPVIDPENLRVVALRVNGPTVVMGETGDVLQISDVREISNIGMIVDSPDDFVSNGDVVKLDKILGFNFRVIGMRVETKKGKKLGKVIDYIVDSGTFNIVQIVVKRPVFSGINDNELVISRGDIIEMDDYKIIVKDATVKSKAAREATAEDGFTPNFVNPFRKPETEQAHNRNLDE
jgi:uncharacterized protein YrrD